MFGDMPMLREEFDVALCLIWHSAGRLPSSQHALQLHVRTDTSSSKETTMAS